jgi:hypothetical protein
VLQAFAISMTTSLALQQLAQKFLPLVGHTITIDWIFMDPNLRKELLRKLLESQGCRHGYGEGLQHE